MAGKSKSLASWLGVIRKQRMPDLGARELDVLVCLWSRKSASAQDVHSRLTGGRIALSTVQSTLERLHRKNLVVREKAGRAYQYASTYTRSQFISRLLRDIADDVAGGDLAPMMSGFAEYIAGESPELDSELARLLRPKDNQDE